MPSPFAITAASNSVRLSDQRQGQAAFTVFNASGRALEGRVQLVPLGPAAAEWLKVTGALSRSFAMGGTEQVTVSIVVPASAPPGSYTFRLDVVGVDNPDGTRIVFLRYDPQLGSQDVLLINADGTDLQTLLVNGAYNRDPTWSPDGKRIAFASNVDAGFNEIYVIDAAGTNQQRLTNNTADDTGPTWSPDGASLAFVSSQNGSADISVMRADGSDALVLTENAAEDIDPAWSPDGTRLAFAANRNANPYQIYTMRRDGGEKRLITRNATGDSSTPAWQP